MTLKAAFLENSCDSILAAKLSVQTCSIKRAVYDGSHGNHDGDI